MVCCVNYDSTFNPKWQWNNLKKNNFKLFLYESLDSHKAMVSVIVCPYLPLNLPSVLCPLVLSFRLFCWASCSRLGSAMRSTKGRWRGWQKREGPTFCGLPAWSVSTVHQWYFLLIKGSGQSRRTVLVCSQHQLPPPPLQRQATPCLSSGVWLEASRALSSLIFFIVVGALHLLPIIALSIIFLGPHFVLSMHLLCLPSCSLKPSVQIARVAFVSPLDLIEKHT